jgi:hypothetical protein
MQAVEVIGQKYCYPHLAGHFGFTISTRSRISGRSVAVRPVEVMFSRSEPPDPAPYHDAFRMKLRFNAHHPGFVLPKAMLDWPVAGADKETRRELGEARRGPSPCGELNMLTQLRQILRVGMLASKASLE